MAKVLDKFVGKTVTVSHVDGHGVEGVLSEMDNHGLLVITRAEDGHEINEKVAVYIPHKDVRMVFAKEDDNLDYPKELFAVGV